MAYRATNEAIELGGRANARIADPRLEALRLYAMLGRYRGDGAQALLAAGFFPAERRVIDAMIDALPSRARSRRPRPDRLVVAILILAPILVGSLTYGWANFYLQDRAIAFIVGGLTLLLLAPLARHLEPSRRATA